MTGTCEHCRTEFAYELVHNGFSDTAFAYCDSCGATAILSAWFKKIPPRANYRGHGPVPASAEPFLLPCDCGGRFRGSASPRCPACHQVLSAELARPWIEANAPGSARGWRWQGSWAGLYCVVVAGRATQNNWLSADGHVQ